MATELIVRLIKLSVVMAMTSLGRESIYRYSREGRFPAPIKVGRNTRWYEHAVKEWIEAQPRAQLGVADCCGIVGRKSRKVRP